MDWIIFFCLNKIFLKLIFTAFLLDISHHIDGDGMEIEPTNLLVCLDEQSTLRDAFTFKWLAAGLLEEKTSLRFLLDLAAWQIN